MDPITNEDIKVAGRVVSISTEGVVADAEQVYDSTAHSFQSAINSNVNSSIANINNRIDNINPQIGDHIDLTKTVEDGGESTTYTATVKINDGGGDSSAVGVDVADNPTFYIPRKVVCADDGYLNIESSTSDIEINANSGDIDINANGRTAINSALEVDGNTSINGTLYVDDNLNANSDAYVDGNLSVSGNLTVSGTLSGGNGQFSSLNDGASVSVGTSATSITIGGQNTAVTTGNLSSTSLSTDSLLCNKATAATDILSQGEVYAQDFRVGNRAAGNSTSINDLFVRVENANNLDNYQDVGVYALIKYKTLTNMVTNESTESPVASYLLLVSRDGSDVVQTIGSDTRRLSGNTWSDAWTSYKHGA